MTILEKLNLFAELGEDWDTYGGSPPSADLINKVAGFLSFARLLEKDGLAVYPTPQGGIQLEWTNNNQKIEIEFFPDGHIEYSID